MKKPYRQQRWKPKDSSSPDVRFFTCARPGRLECGSKGLVPDALVDEWIQLLPINAAIVSLLGRKQNGKSEFSFYSFHGGWDPPAERRGRPSFQEWLDRSQRSISVVQYPTTDSEDVPPDTLAAVVFQIGRLLSEGRTVFLMDSGGKERTAQVCTYMGFEPDAHT